MRNAAVSTVAALAAAIAVSSSAPAKAYELWPAVPPEQGPRPLAGPGPLPWRCSDGPVFNLYHNAWYDAPPAIDRGFAYRPYYRYTAWRVIPRTYFCAER